MWRLKNEALGSDKAHNVQLLKVELEALNGKIPGLIALEVGTDFSKSDSSADVVLCATFNSREDLNSYIEHPLHKAIGASLVRKVVEERRMIDYTI
ncbi:MAG: Dabb family protein [Prevotellaceae bacterium]|nr:Dabb family protein [Prevotellaceae bacterium]